MAQLLSKRKRPPREEKALKAENKLEDGVFDRNTLLALNKLMQAGHFSTLDFPIAKGKEANIYCATTEEGNNVAVKIYRIDTSNFIRMHEYLHGDPRFLHVKKNRFDVVLAWTKKEFSNLKEFYWNGVAVPQPIAFNRNIVVMEFLGKGGLPFPTLEQVGTARPQDDFNFLLDEIKKIYQLGFVHSDISQYNIVVTDGGLKILDCAQAVMLAHPRSEEFLNRDVSNLVKFFQKYKVKCDLDESLAYIKDGKPVKKGLEALV
ncbi:MAG: serine protein kinase RIO [Candidatus Micrarchaeota archaeon]|nr:serine protein kinase RIO [Candidatus Micrarchaeota archaeon]